MIKMITECHDDIKKLKDVSFISVFNLKFTSTFTITNFLIDHNP